MYAAGVNAQNTDATYGTYQTFDYVATFPEEFDEMQADSKVGVGWDPMVMAVISTYDGGKVLVGFGKTGAHLHAGWVAKMWGTKGSATAKKCADNAVITGYVTMATGTVTNLAA